MIGFVIPAHDEGEHIGEALVAVMRASVNPALCGEVVNVVVVLDTCTDSTGAIATRHGVQTLPLAARNVGLARAAGVDLLLDAGARWPAFSEADTQGAPDWLANQLAQDADVVCGSVWRSRPS